MLEPRQLRVLRAVARTGSFAAAARALGCTQQAVRRQITALENSARTPLVVRRPDAGKSGKEISLTEAGEILHGHSGRILTRLHAAEEEMAYLKGARLGRVRLVSFLSGMSELVPTALAGLRAAHPGTEVSFAEAAPPRAVEMLRGGDCDLALAFRYPKLPRDGGAPADDWDGLVAHLLLTDRLLVAVPPGHRLAEAADSGEIALAELADAPWIAGCAQCHGHLVDLCAAEGFAPRIDMVTDDHLTAIALVRAGLGVAVLPGITLTTEAEAVRLLRLEPAVHREIVALTLPEYDGLPAVRALVGELAAAAGTQSARLASLAPAPQPRG
ncbi:LysR family transcriptional regulator [Streptomyces sp. Ru73]|uniref:LysR family transcriptional regulator n=1 Tax=Streptomyces sp. Ru73 TaxID=2080748 RepID=UPI000CDD1998|nr:LysR family transcriptional regulator [Streptomyces sp. Ru73]POX37634.1 LysR family transcriptional regulator [Streptomyces sp. Ru73]